MSATAIDESALVLDSAMLQQGCRRSDGPLHFLQSTTYFRSAWTGSGAKRCFDVLAVLLGLPFALPVLFAVGICVRLNSRGPALFIQARIGKDGAPFKIYKFRTMVRNTGVPRPLVTTIDSRSFTSIGPFLRKWKLDELPQLINVLRGDMSLVGPRPKVPEHQSGLLLCRPGITGAATLAFSREEVLFTRVSKSELHDYVLNVVNPLKIRMDCEYAQNASFISDLKLIFKTVFRKWPDSYSNLGSIGSVTYPFDESVPQAQSLAPGSSINAASCSSSAGSVILLNLDDHGGKGGVAGKQDLVWRSGCNVSHVARAEFLTRTVSNHRASDLSGASGLWIDDGAARHQGGATFQDKEDVSEVLMQLSDTAAQAHG